MTDNEIIKALEHCHSDKGCDECPYNYPTDCYNDLKRDALDLIKRQQKEIEELREINKSRKEERPLLIYTARAEAIKEFAEKFDSVLAEMRDEYHKRDLISYGLVCETIHSMLVRCVKEMVGADNG